MTAIEKIILVIAAVTLVVGIYLVVWMVQLIPLAVALLK